VDAGLDENEAELAVSILAVGLEVLADSDSLLDQHVEIFRDVRTQSCAFCQRELTRSILYSAQMSARDRAVSTCA
jgi:hypothetical protein